MGLWKAIKSCCMGAPHEHADSLHTRRSYPRKDKAARDEENIQFYALPSSIWYNTDSRHRTHNSTHDHRHRTHGHDHHNTHDSTHDHGHSTHDHHNTHDSHITHDHSTHDDY